MEESVVYVVGRDGVQRGLMTETLTTGDFDAWALSMALCGMDRDALIAAVIDYHGEAAIKAHLSNTEPAVSHWRLPVGEGDFPPSRWYVATIHDLHGTKRQPLGSPRRHSGIDINLDFAERGDVERRLGLSVFSITRGVVTYVTDDWGGVGMVVIRHDTIDGPEWWRYAHLVPSVKRGDIVACGDKLGPFANYKDGDHAHVDGADEPITRQWLTAGVKWFDPVERLKWRLPENVVNNMIRQGDA